MKNKLLKLIKRVAIIGFNMFLILALIFLVKSEYINHQNDKKSQNSGVGDPAPTVSENPELAEEELTEEESTEEKLAENENIIDLLKSNMPELFQQTSLQDTYQETVIDSELITNNPQVVGYIDLATPINEHLYEVVGWAYAETHDIDYILLIDSNNKIVGAAVIGLTRPDLVEVFKKEDMITGGWTGYIKLEVKGPITGIIKHKQGTQYSVFGTYEVH